MLIRVLVKNLFSFKEQTEFNLFPGKASRLKHHKYKIADIELLKLSAIYGANGAGKSNLARTIYLLKKFVETGELPNQLKFTNFKLSNSVENDPIELAIEFYSNNNFYFYSFSVLNGRILAEQLSIIQPNNDYEKVLFVRDNTQKNEIIRYYDDFEADNSNETLKSLISKDLLKGNKSLLNLLSTLSIFKNSEIKSAFEWIERKLYVIFPTSYLNGIPVQLDMDKDLAEFANNLMCSFNTGIVSVKVATESIQDYLGSDNQKEIDEIISELTNEIDAMFKMESKSGDDAYAINENGQIVVKRLCLEHKTDGAETVTFLVREESDGTRRLLEYIPALYDLIKKDCTYIIDEIERSIHPIMIKEIINKFSSDYTTKGQLIFTTHESNLLDQEILRTDEIWFAQKNALGETKLYSLSDFKEHSTIDIRKGYLNGRYGAIPFTGNLRDLSWNNVNTK